MTTKLIFENGGCSLQTPGRKTVLYALSSKCNEKAATRGLLGENKDAELSEAVTVCVN